MIHTPTNKKDPDKWPQIRRRSGAASGLRLEIRPRSGGGVDLPPGGEARTRRDSRGRDLRDGGVDLQVEDEEAGRQDLARARDRPPRRGESRRPQIPADLEEADARLLS
jgi:hypothetical protein